MISHDQDRKIFEELMGFLDKQETLAHRDPLMLQIGKFFLESPYEAGKLETKGAERLVVDLRAFDCSTFVEDVLALALSRSSRKISFEVFRKSLRRVRYRDGRLQGYASRLHYFSDWIHDNQRKGILKDVTREFGGKPYRKTFNFMTAHRDLYPALKNAGELRKMKLFEKAISRRSLFFISKEKVRVLEGRIQDGDVVAITTRRPGLDIQHVGFAVKIGARMHFLHASSREGKVALSRETLYRYIIRNKTASGIMIARVTN